VCVCVCVCVCVLLPLYGDIKIFIYITTSHFEHKLLRHQRLLTQKYEFTE